MAANCSCDSGVFPFGFLGCDPKAARPVGLAIGLMKSDATTFNTLGSPMVQNAWEGKVWSTNEKTRLNILNKLTEFVDERADQNIQTIDQIDYVVSEGSRVVTFTMVGAPDKIKRYIDGLNCDNYGFGIITENGELGGWKYDASASALKLIPIQKGTVKTKVMQPTLEVLARVMVSFVVDRSFNDADYGFINSTNVTADVLGTNGMINTITAETAGGMLVNTKVRISLYYPLSAEVGYRPLEGVDTIAWWRVYNNDTASAVTITAIAEPTAGNYELTIAAQTTGDVLTVSNGTTPSPYLIHATDVTSI
jgi:hypothetical protein